MTLNFWAQKEHYLFVRLLLCVALPVFYILAHLCVCSVNESKLYLFAVRETDALLSAQNSLIRKLKEECQTLGAKLEELSQSTRYKTLSDHVHPIHSFIHYKLKPNKKKLNPIKFMPGTRPTFTLVIKVSIAMENLVLRGLK